MANLDTSVYPVKVLEQTTTALEGAVLECLEKPRKGAVHKVRTTTRRIEAQLTLLALTGGFPPYEDEAGRLGKLLKKLRRAAGAVRDLDVQEDLVAREMEGLDGDGLEEARKLRRKLKRQRDAEAEKLESLLRDVRGKLPRRVESLLEVLAVGQEMALEEARLKALVREWYAEKAAPFANAGSDDADRLHSVRKLAKLARYLAEVAPERATRVRALANKFEGMQEAGGRWHDWMVLSEVAAAELGNSAVLPQRFSTHAAEALDEFRKKLRYKV